ncbi:response regulator transcription factor [Amycolatopsis samaneae]|uniref:LuxR C-terminal-related transcriptional regulator n=1 Tax=Amycolatopsis samaneae TaxID=664691 RepID=A0ABW5GEB4_9PSEU
MNFTQTSQAAVGLLVIAGVRFYRDGLAGVLAKLPDVRAVGTAADGAEGLAELRRAEPDIVLLDMALPDAARIAGAVLRVAPGTAVLALGVAETEVLACAEAGIAGYVARDGSLGDLVAAVRAAARGEAVCSPRISASLMRRVAALSHGGTSSRPPGRLTRREREIVDLIAQGLINREIAARLGIELCTVKNHVHNILHKLGVTRRSDVAAFARAAV